MITRAQVEAVWKTSVFEHEDILALTTKILNHEHTDDSNTEIEDLYEMPADGIGEINFFEYEVSRGEQIIEVGGVSRPEYQLTVEVRYTRNKEIGGVNRRKVLSGIETLCNVVRTQLGSTWGTLDVRTSGEIIPEAITQEEVNNTPCYRQVVRFLAFKQ